MRSLFFILTPIVLLAGCGYQIGTSDPGAFFSFYELEGDESIMACGVVEERLKSAGLSRGPDAAAGVVIQCLSEKVDRRPVSVDVNSLGAEYQIVYSIKYGIKGGDGADLLAPSWLIRSDSYLYDRNNLQGSRSQERIIRAELVSRVAEQIIRSINLIGSSR